MGPSVVVSIQGVHYGMFPDDTHSSINTTSSSSSSKSGSSSNSSGGSSGIPEDGFKTLWNAIRPHNWRPTSSKEYLVQLDALTGEFDHLYQSIQMFFWHS
jgi:hypothetical protein